MRPNASADTAFRGTTAIKTALAHRVRRGVRSFATTSTMHGLVIQNRIAKGFEVI
jgi:hypothetical protein